MFAFSQNEYTLLAESRHRGQHGSNDVRCDCLEQQRFISIDFETQTQAIMHKIVTISSIFDPLILDLASILNAVLSQLYIAEVALALTHLLRR